MKPLVSAKDISIFYYVCIIYLFFLAGSDYVPVNETVVFEDSDGIIFIDFGVIFIDFIPIDDNIPEEEEEVNFVISSSMPLVETDNFTAFISDNDCKQ